MPFQRWNSEPTRMEQEKLEGYHHLRLSNATMKESRPNPEDLHYQQWRAEHERLPLILCQLRSPKARSELSMTMLQTALSQKKGVLGGAQMCDLLKAHSRISKNSPVSFLKIEESKTTIISKSGQNTHLI